MVLVIRPKGGIGNRLRVVTSYYVKYIKNKDEKLIVIWRCDKFCNGYFQEYFEPIPNVEFRHNNDEALKINYSGCSRVGPVDFSIIKPLPHIMNKINEKRNLLNIIILLFTYGVQIIFHQQQKEVRLQQMKNFSNLSMII